MLNVNDFAAFCDFGDASVVTRFYLKDFSDFESQIRDKLTEEEKIWLSDYLSSGAMGFCERAEINYNWDAFNQVNEQYVDITRLVATCDDLVKELKTIFASCQEDEPSDNMTDAEADVDTLASAGYGTDEDYGYYHDELERDHDEPYEPDDLVTDCHD